MAAAGGKFLEKKQPQMSDSDTSSESRASRDDEEFDEAFDEVEDFEGQNEETQLGEEESGAEVQTEEAQLADSPYKASCLQIDPESPAPTRVEAKELLRAIRKWVDEKLQEKKPHNAFARVVMGLMKTEGRTNAAIDAQLAAMGFKPASRNAVQVAKDCLSDYFAAAQLESTRLKGGGRRKKISDTMLKEIEKQLQEKIVEGRIFNREKLAEFVAEALKADPSEHIVSDVVKRLSITFSTSEPFALDSQVMKEIIQNFLVKADKLTNFFCQSIDQLTHYDESPLSISGATSRLQISARVSGVGSVVGDVSGRCDIFDTKRTSTVIVFLNSAVVIPPILIFKGKGVTAESERAGWAPDVRVVFQNEGVADADVFKTSILPHILHYAPATKVLVFDSAAQHVTEKVIDELNSCRIHALVINPHLTRVLQACDIYFFSFFKRIFKKITSEIRYNGHGGKMSSSVKRQVTTAITSAAHRIVRDSVDVKRVFVELGYWRPVTYQITLTKLPDFVFVQPTATAMERALHDIGRGLAQFASEEDAVKRRAAMVESAAASIIGEVFEVIEAKREATVSAKREATASAKREKKSGSGRPSGSGKHQKIAAALASIHTQAIEEDSGVKVQPKQKQQTLDSLRFPAKLPAKEQQPPAKEQQPPEKKEQPPEKKQQPPEKEQQPPRVPLGSCVKCCALKEPNEELEKSSASAAMMKEQVTKSWVAPTQISELRLRGPLVSVGKLSVKELEDLTTTNKYISDEVLNALLMCLVTKHIASPRRLHVHSTYFYNLFLDPTSKTGVKDLSLDGIDKGERHYFPLHYSEHWVLLSARWIEKHDETKASWHLTLFQSLPDYNSPVLGPMLDRFALFFECGTVYVSPCRRQLEDECGVEVARNFVNDLKAREKKSAKVDKVELDRKLAFSLLKEFHNQPLMPSEESPARNKRRLEGET